MVETTASGTTMIRGLTTDGQQISTGVISEPLAKTIPDGLGGTVSLSQTKSVNNTQVNSLIRVDGATGNQSWYYDSPGTLAAEFAIRADGTIFVVEYSGSTAQVVGLDGATGNIVSQYQLPLSFGSGPNNIGDSDCTPTSAYSPAGTGPLTIMPDDAVYTEVHTSTSVGTCGALVTIADQDPSGTCLRCTSYYLDDVSNSTSLQLLKLAADGSTQLVPIHSFSVAGVGNVSFESSSPKDVIPDDSGGVLATWDLAVPNGPSTQSSAQVTHLSSSGTNTYTVGIASWCNDSSQDTCDLVLGDNNTVFASTGDHLVAFDENSGTTYWSQSVQTVTLLAAADGGGVFVKKPNPTNNTDDIIQFDSGGTAINTLNFGTTATDMDPLGTIYGAGNGQLLAQNSSAGQTANKPHSSRRGNPSHNRHTFAGGAVPTNFRLDQVTEHPWWLDTVYIWDSSAAGKGNRRLETLANCQIREWVTYPGPIGTADKPVKYQPKSPPWPLGPGSYWLNPTQVVGPAHRGGMVDHNEITNLNFVKPYSYDSWPSTQIVQYSCDGRKTWTDFAGPFSIVRSVMQDPQTHDWHYILTKTGVTTNVDYPLP